MRRFLAFIPRRYRVASQVASSARRRAHPRLVVIRWVPFCVRLYSGCCRVSFRSVLAPHGLACLLAVRHRDQGDR
jgi:hypothetical protein